MTVLTKDEYLPGLAVGNDGDGSHVFDEVPRDDLGAEIYPFRHDIPYPAAKALDPVPNEAPTFPVGEDLVGIGGSHKASERRGLGPLAP